MLGASQVVLRPAPTKELRYRTCVLHPKLDAPPGPAIVPKTKSNLNRFYLFKGRVA